MSYQRNIIRANDLQMMQNSPIRLAGAAIYPGQWELHDPFLSMMNDKFKPGAFDIHPHRGFETVTYVLEGSLAHEDSRGGSGVLGVGDAQWMTAGKGVEHNEHPLDDDFVHVLQLWVNLPAKDKLVDFRYQDLRGEEMPVRRKEGLEIRVFAGESGEIKGKAKTHSPITMLDIKMQANTTFLQELPASYNGFIYVISGAGVFGENRIAGQATQTLWMDNTNSYSESQIHLHAISDLHILLLAGEPLNEPVVAYGPFVMNTEQQIRESISDYRKGNFGQ